ncbi:hypothetical protein CAPTEDRAFT_212536 [Capitella teleta]|uniref:Endonuclease/exonuclease/phosphatase domain-containing protein n=1 Tax=Capitella teleta TaxID=283909 RepID=R7VLP5_CAPTE|nr:hypothetical protein CAPTEDRAFT_212536 [Capitella teleta]|eukprot:ELU17775.1 hypothetical protein CAPTEDRAFT_212536 [Capitella teleta]
MYNKTYRYDGAGMHHSCVILHNFNYEKLKGRYIGCFAETPTAIETPPLASPITPKRKKQPAEPQPPRENLYLRQWKGAPRTIQWPKTRPTLPDKKPDKSPEFRTQKTQKAERRRKKKEREIEKPKDRKMKERQSLHRSCMNRITSLLWNKQKRAKLASLARQHQPDVILVGETWLNETHSSEAVSLEGYSVLARKDRQTKGKKKKGGGVLAYAKKGIDTTATPAPDPQEADVVWLSILSTTCSHLITGIYRPPGSTLIEYYINETLPELSRNAIYLSITILGDFNDHALHRVFDMSSRMGLRQPVNEPTHIKGNMLYLIFTDNDDARVSVLKKADVADHLPVSIKIPDDITIHTGPIKRLWMYHLADLKSLSKYIQKRTSPQKLKQLSPERAINYLDKAIKKGMIIYIPSTVKNIQSSSVPWFDDDCYTTMRESQEGRRSKESYHQLLQEKQRQHKHKVQSPKSSHPSSHTYE